MLLQAVVEEHRRGDDQQPALGGGAPVVPLRQVERPRERRARRARQSLHGAVERDGEDLRRLVGVAERAGGAAHGVGEGADGALAPAGVPRRRERAQRPRHGGVPQPRDGGAAGVADGDRDGGEALAEPGVGVPDGLRPLRGPGLGLEHDAQALHGGHDVHLPAGLAHFRAGVDALPAQQPRQLAVQQLLVVVPRHALPRTPRRPRRRCEHEARA